MLTYIILKRKSCLQRYQGLHYRVQLMLLQQPLRLIPISPIFLSKRIRYTTAMWRRYHEKTYSSLTRIGTKKASAVIPSAMKRYISHIKYAAWTPGTYDELPHLLHSSLSSEHSEHGVSVLVLSFLWILSLSYHWVTM